MKPPTLETISPNFTKLTMGDLEVYFSYQTPIAFRKAGIFTARVNDFSNGTGRHLNKIASQPIRVSGAEFEEALCNILKQ